MVPFQSENGHYSLTKKALFQKRVKIHQQKWCHFSQKRVKIPQQKWYHFRKGSKILNKNGIISEKGQKSSSKIVPFQKRVKIIDKNGTISVRKWSLFLDKKRHYFRKGSKFLNNNGTISEKGQESSTKWYHFRKWRKFQKLFTPLNPLKSPKIKPTLADFSSFIFSFHASSVPVLRQYHASFTNIGARC